MTDSLDGKLRTALHAAGRPCTPQRLQVWNALNSTPGAHLSAAEIHSRCTPLPLATVYNTLELFVTLGLLLPVALEGGVRYDADPSPHINVVCDRCGTVTDVHLSLPPALHDWVESESGYRLTHPHVTWYGRCPDCRL